MTLILNGPQPPEGSVVDVRAVDALVDADPVVADAWRGLQALTAGGPPACGLASGERPAADVEVLAGLAAAAEFELARRMQTAGAAGCLPLPGPGSMLKTRGWAGTVARRLARTGELAGRHPSIAAAWAAGIITSEHVDPIARNAERFTAEELLAVIAELGPHWGSWSPADVQRYIIAAERMLHPPPDDPTDAEADAYEARSLSFALTSDSVLMSGELPRIEGELVIAALDAVAERLRSQADHVPAAARRADALVQLVNDAYAADALPTRGGLPVSVSVTVEHTSIGDPLVTTSRGHQLTDAETRWSNCDATLTPILIGPSDDRCPDPGREARDAGAPEPPSAAARIAALAALMFDTRIPLAVGRSQRTATPAQRRALALRDRGCVIPGCAIPAEACQAHHLVEWAAGGSTDLDMMTLLCWTHHRQVDLGLWTITPGPPPPTGTVPEPGAPPGTPWPANHGAPFTIARTPRHRWRM